MSTIYISTGNGQSSQYDENQVLSMLQQGILRDDSFFWKKGMSDWQPLRTLFPQPTQIQSPPPCHTSNVSQKNMPKFHCIHCGQHINTLELMPGNHSQCPSCGGAIQVPIAPMLPPLLPQTNDVRAKSNSVSGKVATVIFLIICVAGGVAGKNCAQSLTPNRSIGASYSEAHTPPSTDTLSFYDVAGLRIKLPSIPIQEEMKLPPEVTELVRSFELYKVNHSGAMISISRMVYNIPEVNLDGSADGAISQIRSLPSTTDFSSSKSEVTVSGLQGKQIALSARRSGQQIAMHGLVFARGSEAWQIQVVGSSTYGDELKHMSDSIFSSIMLSEIADSSTTQSSELNQAAVTKQAPVYNFSDEWYAAKSACWQRVIGKYPDSGVNGSAFRKRMFELDEWAKTNNPDLYSDSNKPMIFADTVYREMVNESR